MNDDFVIKSMEEFLLFMKEKINEGFEDGKSIESLYETYFAIQWLGKTVYIPFCANSSNKLIDILEEELGIIEV